MVDWFKSLLIYIANNRGFCCILLIFFIAIAGLLRLQFRTQVDDNWDVFKVEHHCQVVKSKGGNNIQSSWLCDDGNEYYRWRQQR
jgi:hypothetical protein